MNDLQPETPELALKVVKGNPSDEELAAVLTVVADAFTQEEFASPQSRSLSRWQLSARATRGELNRLAGWAGSGKTSAF